MKCCMVSAGDMRHQIAIQRLALSDDGYGGHSKAWSTIHTPRAKVVDRSGSESMSPAAVRAVATTVFTLRYIAGITAVDRILFGGVAYNIRHIDNVEYRDRWLVITTTKNEVD